MGLSQNKDKGRHRQTNEKREKKMESVSKIVFPRQVVVVSECFEGVKAIDRHRKVNSILSGELGSGSGGGGVHALSIVAKTPKQWHESGENAGKSPPCRGGMGL